MLKIKQAIYRRWRADKQLLVIALGETVRLSLYQQSALQWEKSFPYENDAALEACVRDCLLEHDVEENVPALLLLDAGRLQSEQLTLPTLTPKQLRKTLAWEAEQLFTECSYCYKTMAGAAASEGAELTTSLQQDAEQQLVQLYALPHARQKLYGALCSRLLVKLEAICVLEQESVQKSEQGQSALPEQELMQADTVMAVDQCDADALVERAVQQWFAGAELLRFPPLPTAVDWQRYRDTARTLLPRVACASLLLAVVAFGCAFAACYFTHDELQSLQQDAERYAVWHERRAESVQLEQRLAALKQQAQQRKAVTGVSKELEAWGGLRLQGAYLTRLEFKTSQEKQNAAALVKTEKQEDADIKGKKKDDKQKAVVTVRGVASDEQALDGILESLQRSSRYSSVQLMQVQRQADATAFSVQASVAGGK